MRCSERGVQSVCESERALDVLEHLLETAHGNVFDLYVVKPCRDHDVGAYRGIVGHDDAGKPRGDDAQEQLT